MFLSFIYIVPCIKFILFVLHCMDTPQFVVDTHLGYLQFLAVMVKVAMDIFYMSFFFGHIFPSSLGKHLRIRVIE